MNYEIDLNLINEFDKNLKISNDAALIIIEPQKLFVSDLPIISKQQITNFKKLITYAITNKIKYYIVQHNDSNPEITNLVNWWNGDKLEVDSEAWQIIDDLENEKINATIIHKNQYSAFYQTNLEVILKNNNVRDIIIAGVMTNCCAETTARHGFMLGFNVFFVNDAVSTVNQDLHLSTIKNLSFGFAKVLNTNDVINQTI